MVMAECSSASKFMGCVYMNCVTLLYVLHFNYEGGYVPATTPVFFSALRCLYCPDMLLQM